MKFKKNHPNFKLLQCSELPHTQGTQGIFKLKKISGNFDLFFKLRESVGASEFWCFSTLKKKVLIFPKKFREVLRFKKSQELFCYIIMRFN